MVNPISSSSSQIIQSQPNTNGLSQNILKVLEDKTTVWERFLGEESSPSALFDKFCEIFIFNPEFDNFANKDVEKLGIQEQAKIYCLFAGHRKIVEISNGLKSDIAKGEVNPDYFLGYFTDYQIWVEGCFNLMTGDYLQTYLNPKSIHITLNKEDTEKQYSTEECHHRTFFMKRFDITMKAVKQLIEKTEEQSKNKVSTPDLNSSNFPPISSSSFPYNEQDKEQNDPSDFDIHSSALYFDDIDPRNDNEETNGNETTPFISSSSLEGGDNSNPINVNFKKKTRRSIDPFKYDWDSNMLDTTASILKFTSLMKRYNLTTEVKNLLNQVDPI